MLAINFQTGIICENACCLIFNYEKGIESVF